MLVAHLGHVRQLRPVDNESPQEKMRWKFFESLTVRGVHFADYRPLFKVSMLKVQTLIVTRLSLPFTPFRPRLTALVEIQVAALDKTKGVVDRLHGVGDGVAWQVGVCSNQKFLPIKNIIDDFTAEFTSIGTRDFIDTFFEVLRGFNMFSHCKSIVNTFLVILVYNQRKFSNFRVTDKWSGAVLSMGFHGGLWGGEKNLQRKSCSVEGCFWAILVAKPGNVWQC